MAKDDVVIKTIIAEAGGDPSAMAAVASVIRNRALKEGKTPEQIVKARGQFEGYSNPGPASIRAQQDAKVLARARDVWSGVQNGTVADPTNGATQYHASYVTPYWADSANKHGTVNIGGNIFYKGKGPVSAPAPATAIDAINKAVPLPVPRPAPPVLSAFTDAPQSGADALSAILGQRYQSSAPTADAASADGDILPPVPLPRPRPSPPMISRSVNTVPIDPNTGAPYASASQYAADTEAARLRAALQQRAPFVSEDHPRSNAVVPPPKVSFFSTPQGPVPTEFQQTNPLGRLFNASPAPPTPSVGSIRTIGQAGNVALPPGVVPKSVQRDLPIVQAQQNNKTDPWFPFNPPPPAAPTPMPGRPPALSQSYIPGPSNGYSGVKDTSQMPPSTPLDFGQTVEDLAPVQAITKQVLNPDYVKWQVSQTPALKSGQAYTSTGATIPRSMADAMRAVPSSSYMRPVTPHVPMPPKFISQTVTVPLPRPRPQPVAPQRSGGLLGLLFPGTNQGAFGLMGQGISGLLNGGGSSAPSGPPPGTSYLAAQGTPTAGLTIGQQQNELMKSLAGGSRNPDGTRAFY